MLLILGLLLYFCMVMIVDADPDKSLLRLALIPLFIILYKFKPVWDNYLAEQKSNQALKRFFLILLVLLSIARCLQFQHKLKKPIGFIEDIAVLNKDAFHTFFIEHKNPYQEKINSYRVGDKDYAGYKYPPLQIFTYAPFVWLAGQKGIYWGNLLSYIGLGLLLYFVLLPYGRLYAYLGTVLYLATDYHYVLSFNHGTNDHLPSLLMLAALICYQANKHKHSGLALGLALLGKQLPGLILGLFLFVYREWKVVLMAAIVFIIGSLPFMIWDFQSYYENTFEFALTRPVRETSILIYMKPFWQKLTQLLGLIGVISIAHVGKRNSRYLNLKISTIGLFIGTCLFLITAKMTPAHYFVWTTGLMILSYLIPIKK